MKNKVIIIIAVNLLIIGMLFGTSLKSYAENETVENSEKNNSITSTTSNVTSQKSSNANLKNLGIKPHDFTGFKSSKTSYDVTVPEDTESVEVYAQTSDVKAKVSGTGTINLENGKNLVDVVVTAEDGTKKTYTINITKKGTQQDEQNKVNDENQEESNEDSQENSNGLLNLQINQLELTPSFKTNVYEYMVKYIGEDEKLDIKAEPTDEDYTVEIVGNNDLKEGKNIITILVSEKNENNVATYQIKVEKSLVDEEAIAKEEAQRQREQKKKAMICAGIAVVIIAIIFFMIKRRRSQAYGEDYSEVSLYGLDDDEDEEQATEEYQNLDNYNWNSAENETEEDLNYYEEEFLERKTRHKGKRFK